jgi:hypothetical protein
MMESVDTPNVLMHDLHNQNLRVIGTPGVSAVLTRISTTHEF